VSLAYAVVLADSKMFDQFRRDTVAEAQRAADQRFEKLAREARKTTVTRNPEPHVMTWSELRQAMPTANLDGLVGLYFTADIT